MKKYKVRIKDMPNMAYGGQQGYGLDLGRRVMDNEMRDDLPYSTVSDTLQPVPRYMANLEAEKGETVMGDVDGDGQMEHMKVGGKRHSEGGTPLNLQPGAFVFSDTKKMRVGGAPLEMFGKNPDSKKKFTPAQLAKQYDLNKYKAILDDPLADPLSKKTAQMMMENNQKKLGQLALLQESMKGFPQGIPDVAQSAMPQAAFGGYMPMAQTGIEAWAGDKYSGVKNASRYDTDQLRFVARALGLNANNTLELQREVLKNPEWKKIVADEHKAKGMPYADRMDDGKWGYRWDTALGKIVQKKANDDALKKMQLPVNMKLPEITRERAGIDQFTRTPMTEEAEETRDLNGPKVGEVGAKYTMPMAGYMTPDKLAALQALNTKAKLPTIRPFMTTPGYVKPEGTFMDPTRDYAANAEQANLQMQGMRTFGRPQAFLAGASQIAGKTIAANEAAGSAVNKQNVMLANQFEQQGNALDNQYLQNRAQGANMYAEMANNAMKENFRNENAADAQMVAAASNAWNNRMMVNMTNAANPYFMLDPRSGMVNLKNPNMNPLAGKASSGSQQTYPELIKYAQDTLKMPYEKAVAWADEAIKLKGRSTTVDKNNDGYPDYTQAMSSMMQALAGMRN